MSYEANSIILQLIADRLQESLICVGGTCTLHKEHKKREHLSINCPYGRIVVKVDDGIVHIKQPKPMEKHHSRRFYNYHNIELNNPANTIDTICVTIIDLYMIRDREDY